MMITSYKHVDVSVQLTHHAPVETQVMHGLERYVLALAI